MFRRLQAKSCRILREIHTQNACILSLVSVAVTTLKYRLLGLHFKIEINEITGVNQKEVLLSSGLKPD